MPSQWFPCYIPKLEHILFAVVLVFESPWDIDIQRVRQ